MIRIARELARWGASPSAGIAAAAIRYPDETMIIDELGSLTFREVHSRSNRLARALAKQGIGEGDGSRSWLATTAASSMRCSRSRSWARTRCS